MSHAKEIGGNNYPFSKRMDFSLAVCTGSWTCSFVSLPEKHCFFSFLMSSSVLRMLSLTLWASLPTLLPSAWSHTDLTQAARLYFLSLSHPCPYDSSQDLQLASPGGGGGGVLLNSNKSVLKPLFESVLKCFFFNQ